MWIGFVKCLYKVYMNIGKCEGVRWVGGSYTKEEERGLAEGKTNVLRGRFDLLIQAAGEKMAQAVGGILGIGAVGDHLHFAAGFER